MKAVSHRTGRRKGVCNTAKVWCKQGQRCVSSHSSTMTVKSSLEVPLLLRTKDNLRLILRAHGVHAKAEKKHTCCRHNLISHQHQTSVKKHTYFFLKKCLNTRAGVDLSTEFLEGSLSRLQESNLFRVYCLFLLIWRGLQ